MRHPSRSFFDAASPAAWLWAVITGVGALFTLPLLVHSGADGGEYSFLLITISLFSLFPVFLLFRWLGAFVATPHGSYGATFLWGLFGASTHARIATAGLAERLSSWIDPAWIPTLVPPLLEEPSKLTGVALVMWGARGRVHSLFDGLLLGAFAGLGFEIAENFAYHLHWLHDAAGDLTAGADVLALRSLNTLVGGHVIYTAIAGAGFAYLLTAHEHGRLRRLLAAAGCLALALALHAFWNSPLLVAELPGSSYILRGLPGLLALLTVVAWAGRRETAHLAAVARSLPEGTIRADEVAALVHPFARLRGAVSRALLPSADADRAVLVRNAQLAAARAKRLGYAPPVIAARVRAVTAARSS